MKSRNYIKLLTSLILFAVLITGSTSCTKDDTGALSLTGTANVMVVNAADGTSPQDYYSDGTKVNSSAVAYTQNSGYASTPAGNHAGVFKVSGTTTVTASGDVTFESGKYYSVYLIGSATGTASFVTEDDMSAPPSGKSKVRFVHLSAALASSIDFGITGGNKIVSALAYKTASTYNTVDANTGFTLYLAGSTTGSLTIPAAVQAGKIYTVFISGSTTATLTYRVIVQN